MDDDYYFLGGTYYPVSDEFNDFDDEDYIEDLDFDEIDELNIDGVDDGYED